MNPGQASSPTQIAQGKPVVAPAGTKQADAESETVVESDLYRVTFTNRGAQVKSWILKKFDDDQGRPLDLVNRATSDRFGYPFSLWTYDENQRNQLNSALYVVASSGEQAPAQIAFEYANQGLVVRKTFHFDNSYVVNVETLVQSNGNTVAAYLAWPAALGDQVNAIGYAASRIEYQNNSDIERLTIKKISGGATLHGLFNWAGITDQYFAAVFLPENAQNAVVVTLRNAIDVPKDPSKPNSSETIKADVLGVAAGDSQGATLGRVFVGPKELQSLEAVKIPTISGAEADLRGLVNFGFFHIIARPLFLWLKWTYDHMIHNWGWAIVIQTLIINLTLLPLRISSMRSALKMQKIQPQMNSIKEKYKKYAMRDPRRQEMNTEIGALMKQEGVNPVGGCLPLVIQMPFLFAYYSMLASALDLRHAHWLWVRDLSSADPYYILPIGIIITGLLTQRMTPQAGMDPSQQKMMNVMMPVMFGFISFRLASGLCLYWSEGSLIAIAQQLIMNRTSLGREMREMAEKRARKKEKKGN